MNEDGYGLPSVEPTSPLYTHVRSKQLEGTYPGDPMEGVWPVTAARVGHGWGAVLEREWPYESCSESWPPREPPGLDAKAKAFRCQHYQRVRSALECRLLLAHCIAVPAAFEITNQWFTAEGGAITMPSATDEIVGSHQVCLLGFDIQLQGFRFVNSWGSEWGQHGWGYLPFRYFDKYLVDSWCPHGFRREPPGFDGATGTDEDILWGMPDRLGDPVRGGGVIHGRHVYDSVADERCGWLFAVVRGGVLEVEELYVRPQYRRKGYGRRLVSMLKELRTDIGVPLRLWITHADMEAANRSGVDRLVESLGLTVVPSPFRWAAALATDPQADPLCLQSATPDRVTPPAIKPRAILPPRKLPSQPAADRDA